MKLSDHRNAFKVILLSAQYLQLTEFKRTSNLSKISIIST